MTFHESTSFFLEETHQKKAPNQKLGFILAYGSICAALYEFILRPSVKRRLTVAEAARSGALLGLGCYGCFDGTLLATNGISYPLDFALKDVVWGVTVMAISGAVTAAIAGEEQRQRKRHERL